jgi:hypothetical protein
MPKKVIDKEVSIPMVGESDLILPEYFVQKNKKTVKRKVNGKTEEFMEDVYKLVNPLTKTRHLAKRGGEPVIKLIRKPVENMVLDELNRDIPLSKFSKGDRDKIEKHFEKIESHKDKVFWEVPNSDPFKNLERGRPEKLPRNIRVNKERKKAGYKTAGQLKKEERERIQAEKQRIREQKALDKANKPKGKRGRSKKITIDFGEPENEIIEEEVVIEEPKPKRQSYVRHQTEEEKKEAIRKQKRESAKRAEKRPYKKYETEEERKEAIKQQKRESARRKKEGSGIDLYGRGIKEDIKNFGNKIVKGVKNIGHTIVHKTNETTNTIKHNANKGVEDLKTKMDELKAKAIEAKDKAGKYINAVVKGRTELPPKVRDILSKYGDNIIDTITICRTPVPGILTGALSALSGGAFGKALKNAPYDKLFHLFLRISIDNGMVLSMEKNEVINMDIDPPIPKDTETKPVNIPLGMTSNELMEGAKRVQGGKFLGYSARDNNCQDFILAIFNGCNIGNQEDRDFIKQETKSLFGDNVGLRKFSNTITDLGGIANTVMTGAGLDDIEWGSFTKYFKNRPKKLRHLTTLGQLADYIIKHPKDFTKHTLKRAMFYHNVIEKKSIHNNMGRRRRVVDSDSDSESGSDMEGKGIKEMWNNSKFGKTVNNAVKRHKKVIDAVREDPSVQRLYHSKHIAPFHSDIDAAVHHFGSGLGTGLGTGMEGAAHHGAHMMPMGSGLYAGNPTYGGQIHHHHHLHIEGGGMWDWADPRKNGVAKAFDPNQNGVAKAFQPITNVVQKIPTKKEQFEDLGKRIRDEMEKRNINNKGALQGLKTAGHYAIPATTSALGGIAGTTLGALTTGGLGSFAGGIAGSAAGSYAGDKINQKLGIGLHKRKGRFVKGSQEAKDHMRRIREMRKK